MDLSKLSPAPWRIEGVEYKGEIDSYEVRCPNPDDDPLQNAVSSLTDKDNAELIALARNAFDVMMRRGWHVRRASTGEWVVYHPGDGRVGLSTMVGLEDEDGNLLHSTDPFTALVEADLWYRENVENGRAT